VDTTRLTRDQEAELAELPFQVIALALARDTQLRDEEIAAAQRALNALDLAELMRAVRGADHSPTELFELAWLEDDPAAAVSARAERLTAHFGPRRARALREELALLARLVSAASDRPLRGRNRATFVRAVERALDVNAAKDRAPRRSGR
jgi:hypothetical protein